MKKVYKNALGDLFYSDKKHEEEMQKLDALKSISDKPATTNTLLYAIPIVALVIFGVVFAVALKRKKA